MAEGLLKQLALAASAALIGLGTAAYAADRDDKPKSKPYPLTVCLVTDEKLGEMGEPHVIHYKGREIKFCCEHCEEDFKKEPKKYLAKLDKAAKSSATQPATRHSEKEQDGHKHGDKRGHDHKH